MDPEPFLNDLRSLHERLEDDDFARRVYAALCNTDWRRGDAEFWCTFRQAAELIAEIRGRGESYLDFYWSMHAGEIADAVRVALGELGWTPAPAAAPADAG